MKILFLLRFFPVYGGGETVTLRLSEAFLELGIEVHIFYLWNNGTQKYSSKLKIFKVEDVHEPKNKENICSSDKKNIYDSLQTYINNNKVDIVINQWLDPRKVFQASNNRVKIYNCRHAAVYINSKKWNLCRKLMGEYLFDFLLSYKYRDYIQFCDKYVLLCDEYAKEMKNIYHHKGDTKIVSMLNPCRFDIPSLIDFQSKENAICYVGRLYKEKQVDILIKSWKYLEKIVLKNKWVFYIVGTGDDLQRLQELSDSLECRNLNFEGFQVPIEYYKKAKIFVSASATEGYPMTIIEAMAYGVVPVIANTYSALKGIIPDDVNGVKVDSVDANSFAIALGQLMNNEEVLINKSRAAFELCKQNYSAGIIAKKWMKLFDENNEP